MSHSAAVSVGLSHVHNVNVPVQSSLRPLPLLPVPAIYKSFSIICGRVSAPFRTDKRSEKVEYDVLMAVVLKVGLFTHRTEEERVPSMIKTDIRLTRNTRN